MGSKLTAIGVAKAKADPARRREIPDGGSDGLYLVVQPGGAKSWAFRYRFAGKPKKLSLGPLMVLEEGESEPQSEPEVGKPLTLRGARELAGKQQRCVAREQDPAAARATQRRQLAATGDVEDVLEDFLARHVAVQNRPRTAAETERLLRSKVMPEWKGRKLTAVKRRDVIDLLDGIVAAGAPVSANRVLAAVRKFFNWCIERDLIAVSPCSGVKPPTQEQSRSRHLSEDEIRLVWAACGKIGHPFGPMIRLLLVTGQRLTEVAHMRWAEVDLDEKIWRLPAERVKNGEPHDVPLSPLAISLLKDLGRMAGEPDYVFTTGQHRKGRDGEAEVALAPVSGFSKAKLRLDRAILEARRQQAAVRRSCARDRGAGDDVAQASRSDAGLDASKVKPIPAWRLHDLRRTVATQMAGLGVALPVVERVLNHTSGSFAGIVGVYQRHSYADEKRAALKAWSAHVAALTGLPHTSP